MRRRKLIGLLSGSALGWSFAAGAQLSGGMKHVAILNGNPENAATRSRVAAFQQALASLGWREGDNVGFDVRWGAADAARVQAYAAELVKLNPDVILATNTPTARSLKLATDAIPIVFAGLADPVSDGIVTDLSKPGRNITGFTSFNAPIAGKWLELVKQLSPATTAVGVIYNPATAPHSVFLPLMRDYAAKLGVVVVPKPVSDQSGIESTVASLAREPNSGLVALPDIFMSVHGPLVFTLALKARLASVGPLRSYAEDGALASYGSDFLSLFRQASSYVDRILRGEKPGDLPIQEPTKYELIINLKTARAMALTVPYDVLARADDVIE